MKFSVFIATSLDGFIARKNGSVDWLPAVGPDDAEGGGFVDFFQSVDCMVMGRNSMEMVLSFGQWPYEGKPVIVLSNTLKAVPEVLSGKIEIYSGSFANLVKKLENAGYKRIYVDGGKTIQSFINEALITDLSITRIPILLGEGLPLFGKISKDVHLNHIATQSFSNGFVNSVYGVVSE